MRHNHRFACEKTEKDPPWLWAIPSHVLGSKRVKEKATWASASLSLPGSLRCEQAASRHGCQELVPLPRLLHHDWLHPLPWTHINTASLKLHSVRHWVRAMSKVTITSLKSSLSAMASVCSSHPAMQTIPPAVICWVMLFTELKLL